MKGFGLLMTTCVGAVLIAVLAGATASGQEHFIDRRDQARGSSMSHNRARSFRAV